MKKFLNKISFTKLLFIIAAALCIFGYDNYFYLILIAIIYDFTFDRFVPIDDEENIESIYIIEKCSKDNVKIVRFSSSFELAEEYVEDNKLDKEYYYRIYSHNIDSNDNDFESYYYDCDGNEIDNIPF